MLDSQITKKAYMSYGLSDVVLRSTRAGYRNYSCPATRSDGVTVNLILYKSEPHILEKIKTANQVANFLYINNFPARYNIDPRILKLKTPTAERYASLYSYLPGETIPWEAYTRKHLKALGGTMARMHTLLRSMPCIKAPNVPSEYINIIKRMENYFKDPSVSKAILSKLNIKLEPKQLSRCLAIMEVCQKLPNQQMLHMDFVRGNVLFEEHNGEVSVSGVLDFEKAGYGHILIDIARTLAFLLVDCKYKTDSDIQKRFLAAGYIRSGNVNLNDIILRSNSQKTSLLRELTTMFMIYDFYKFLKHNPYEYLDQNEHFIRTRNLLVDRGVITTSPYAK